MYKKILIISVLMLFKTQTYSVPYASEDFKYDSVIPPLALGEYKVLNGCPAILKKETKDEENCPVDYTGTIKYERTLTADKVLFGDNVTCEKVYKGNITINTENSGNIFGHVSNRQVNVNDFIGDITINGKYGVDQSVSMAFNSKGSLNVTNVKTVTIPKYNLYYATEFSGGLNFKNVSNINLSYVNIANDLTYVSDYPNDITYVNVSDNTNISSDVYLNGFAFFSQDSSVKISGTIHDERIPKMLDANFCSGININGDDSGWKYFETNPNLAFNIKIYDSSTNQTKGFRNEMFNNANKTYFSYGGKYCVVNAQNYNIDNQKNAKVIYNDSVAAIKTFQGNGNCFSNSSSKFFYLNELGTKGPVKLARCQLMAKKIEQYSTYNVELGYFTPHDSSFGNYYVDDVIALNSGLAVTHNWLGTTGNSKIKNANVATLSSVSNVGFENLNLNLFNTKVGIKQIYTGTSVDGVIDNLNITIRDDAFSIGSTYTFNTNSTTLRLINPIRFDGRSDVKFTFNNKVNSNIYGDIYLNPISSYERDSTSKWYGNIYGGNQDYSSVSENP